MVTTKPGSSASEELPEEAQRLVDFAVNNPLMFEAVIETVGRAVAEKAKERRSSDYAQKLISLLATLQEEVQFNPGDLVCWKAGMRNRTRPDYGEPAIIVEVLADAISGKAEESGSAYFREPLDVKAGVCRDDGEFSVYHYDSRRFRLFAPDDRIVDPA